MYQGSVVGQMVKGARRLMIQLTIAAVTFAMPTLVSAAESARQISSDKKGNCQKPVWSKDGKQLAFERAVTDEDRLELYVVRDVGSPSEERVLPDLGGKGNKGDVRAETAKFGVKGSPAEGDVCREFSWFPGVNEKDKSIFAFSCNVGYSGYQVFWRPAENSLNQGEVVTRDQGTAGQAVFNQNWTLAYVASPDGDEGLYIVKDFGDNLEKGRGLKKAAPKRLFSVPGRFDRMPAWSPDGKALAFVGHQSATGGDIYVVKDINKPETSVQQITNWTDEETNPSWSPDGTKIAFYSNRNHAKKKPASKKERQTAGLDSRGIYIAELGSSEPPYLLVDNVMASEGRGPSWTPDGRWIVFVKDAKKKNIVDPIRAIEVKKGAAEVSIPTGTNSNEEVDVVGRGDEWWATFTALTLKANAHAWRKVYVYPLSALKSGTAEPAK